MAWAVPLFLPNCLSTSVGLLTQNLSDWSYTWNFNSATYSVWFGTDSKWFAGLVVLQLLSDKGRIATKVASQKTCPTFFGYELWHITGLSQKTYPKFFGLENCHKCGVTHGSEIDKWPNIDIWYIKMLRISRSSISSTKNRGFVSQK